MEFLYPREPVNAWTHGIWLALAIPGTVLLWRRSACDRGKRTSLFIYGLSLIFCATASTLYHGVHASRSHLSALALLDFVGIYFLIAGSYTAIVWNLMRGRWRRGILSAVWFWAFAGTAIRLSGITLPAWLSTGIYLLMGWGSVFCFVELTARLSYRDLLPIPVGGILYSVGALLNLLHRPVGWPGVFQAHEVFHLLVMAGSLVHFGFVLFVVVPFEYRRGMPLNATGPPGLLPPASAATNTPALADGSRRGLA